MKFKGEDIDEHDEIVGHTDKGSYILALKKLDLDFKNRATSLVEPSIKNHPILQIKYLPS